MHCVSRICLSGLVCAFAFCALSTAEVRAQSKSLFGNRGPAGQSGARSGSGTTGRSPLTGSGLGQSTVDITTKLGALSANVGQGFTGRGNNAGQFVGSRFAGQGNAQQTNTARLGRLGGQGSQRNGFGNTAISNQLRNRAGRTRRVIRPLQRIAFSFPKPEPSSISKSLQTQLGKLASRGIATSGVTLTLDENGQVTLHGEVDSERTRKLAEITVRLEPGVRAVRNELTLKPSGSSG